MGGVSRQARIANYAKLIAALRVADCSPKDMQGVINASHGSANHYRKAMEKFGILRAVRECNYATGVSGIFALTNDEPLIASFMDFIAKAKNIDEELSETDESFDLPRRFITAAKQMGIPRPDYLACLFGQPQNVKGVTA